MTNDYNGHTTSTDPSELVAGRLDRLERENRRLRRTMSVIVLGALIATIAGARGNGVPKQIEAEAFILRSPDGKQLATLDSDPFRGDPHLNFWSKDGHRLSGLGSGGLGFNYRDDDGVKHNLPPTARLTLGLDPDGSYPALRIQDEKGKLRGLLGTDDRGTTRLVIFDQKQKPRVDIKVGSVDGKDVGIIEITDGDGNVISKLPE